jgi:hypothetical protein
MGKEKCDEALKPKKLSKEFKPEEFTAWVKRYKEYYDSGNMAAKTVEKQRANLNSCLEPDMQCVLDNRVDDVRRVIWDKDDACIAVLKEQFMRLYPLYSRRQQFYTMECPRGQSMAEFRLKIVRAAKEANIAEMKEDDHISVKLITSCTDQKLKMKMLEMEKPTREKLEAVIDTHESAMAGEQSLRATVEKANRAGQPKRGGGARGSSSSSKCGTCGRNVDHGNKPCWAKTKKCNECGVVGHLAAVCKAKAKATREEPAAEEKEEQQPEQARVVRSKNEVKRKESALASLLVGKPTPPLMFHFRACDNVNNDFSHDVCPDTGCTRTLAGLDVATRNGVRWVARQMPRMEAANGAEMPCPGFMDVTAEHKGRKNRLCVTLTTDPGMAGQILLGWEDCKKFGILHPTWPEPFDAARSTRTAPTSCEEVIERIKEEFADVLADELPKTPMKGKPMKIHMVEEGRSNPKKTFIARKLPIHQEEEANKLVNELMSKNVIAKQEEPTDWVSPAMFVPKPNGKLRLVTDYTHLNRYLKRPIHPFPSAKEMMQGIKADSKVFMKLDAVSGYWQMPVAEEDQHLTTFLLPTGRYKYLRGPMGLAPTSDEWNIRSDRTIEGLDWAEKIVDDTLIQAPDPEELWVRARIVMTRCREWGITISIKKLQAGSEIPFAGYVVGSNGIKPDPDRIKAIRDMEVEKSIPGVRSFLGLANQLGQFVPDLAQNTNGLRQLLKKENAFVWTADHDTEVSKVKDLLTSPGILKPFDPKLKTELLTDAARIHGMGFALLQREDNGAPRLVICGSTSMTSAQTRYAVIECEMLALTWAIEKCEFYLKGIPSFLAVTDHKPLVGIMSKDLNDIRNPRLLRMRMRIMQYSFDIQWKAGKTHLIADALSRAPVFRTDAEEGTEAKKYEDVCRKVTVMISEEKGGVGCNEMLDAAAEDKEYMQMVQEVIKVESMEKLSPILPARQLKHVWGRVSILGDPEKEALMLVDGKRIVVPAEMRTQVVRALHRSHSGMEKSKTMARQLFWWPGMMNEIEIACAACSVCTKYRPSQTRELMTPPPRPYAPMSHVGADLFDYKGKPWLVMVDRYSGWPFVEKMKGSDTVSVCSQLARWFNLLGWPSSIRTDGGPAFRLKFAEFCRKRGMEHELSSAYSAQSNGLSEAAVKACKHLLAKTMEQGEDFEEAMAAYRNTPRADGFSPAQLMLGRRMKGPLPMLQSQLEVEVSNFSAGREAREKTQAQSKKQYDSDKKEMEKLKKGDSVIVQCQHSKRWTKKATVISIRRSGHSYNLEDEDGFTFVRNRRFIKLRAQGEEEFEENEEGANVAAPPRRSTRASNKCKRVQSARCTPAVRVSHIKGHYESFETVDKANLKEEEWVAGETPKKSLRPSPWLSTARRTWSTSRVGSTSLRSTRRRPATSAKQRWECAAAVCVGAAYWRACTAYTARVAWGHCARRGLMGTMSRTEVPGGAEEDRTPRRWGNTGRCSSTHTTCPGSRSCLPRWWSRHSRGSSRAIRWQPWQNRRRHCSDRLKWPTWCEESCAVRAAKMSRNVQFETRRKNFKPY